MAEAFTSILRTVKTADGTRILNFRAYLMTATRHAAIDRRRSREVAVDTDLFAEDGAFAGTDTPPDQVIDLTDTAFARRAFRDLPERWRRVLWLTEVEGLRPADAAPRLGMNANAVAQLAFRARSGLRERYLSAHLAPTADEACDATVQRLPAYVLKRLGRSELAAVQGHLGECTACTSRHEELEAVGASRRLAAFAPFVLLGGLVRRAFNLSTAGEPANAAGALTAAKLAAAAVATAVSATGGLATFALRAGELPAPAPSSSAAVEVAAVEISTTTVTFGPASAVEPHLRGAGHAAGRAAGHAGVNGNGSETPPGQAQGQDHGQVQEHRPGQGGQAGTPPGPDGEDGENGQGPGGPEGERGGNAPDDLPPDAHDDLGKVPGFSDTPEPPPCDGEASATESPPSTTTTTTAPGAVPPPCVD